MSQRQNTKAKSLETISASPKIHYSSNICGNPWLSSADSCSDDISFEFWLCNIKGKYKNNVSSLLVDFYYSSIFSKNRSGHRTPDRLSNRHILLRPKVAENVPEMCRRDQKWIKLVELIIKVVSYAQNTWIVEENDASKVSRFFGFLPNLTVWPSPKKICVNFGSIVLFDISCVLGN